MELDLRKAHMKRVQSVEAGAVFKRDGEAWIRTSHAKVIAVNLSNGHTMAAIESNLMHEVEVIGGAFVEDY